jgi:threonine/homoserine/homoserine lactone efflux protein
MESLSILYFFIALATTIIGAVPFGLVNLSVADTATKTNTRKSMEVASGATLVEVIFALAALLTGASLQNYLSSNHWVNLTVAGVLFGAGLIFWLKKYNKTTSKVKPSSAGSFLKGAFLNLISIQVLLFWLMAAAFLSVHDLIPGSPLQFILFITGVGIAKTAVLLGYAVLARKVAEKSKIISRNMNRIIGFILVSVALYQLINI